MFKKLSMFIAVFFALSAFFIFSACDGDAAGGFDITVNIGYDSEDGTVTAYGILLNEGASCESYGMGDIAYKASAVLSPSGRVGDPGPTAVSGTMTMTSVAAGTYVACVFIDLDGLTDDVSTTLANAAPESGDEVNANKLDVVLNEDKIYPLADGDFNLLTL